MRVPLPTSTRTRPSGQGLGYLEAPAGNPFQPIVAGLAGIGGALERRAQVDQQLADENEAELAALRRQDTRFESLTKFSAFETTINTQMAELKRSAPVEDKEFIQRSNAMFDKEFNAFLQSVPPELQSEFKFRANQLKQGAAADATNFQFGLRDKFYKTAITGELEKAKLSLSQDPSRRNLATWQGRMEELIRTSNVPESEKEEFIKAAKEQVQAIVFKADVKAEKAVDARLGTRGSFVRKVIGVESGGKANTKNPRSSASGLGQFIDSTWRQFIRERHPEYAPGEEQKARPDVALQREAVEWYAEKNEAALRAEQLPVTEGNLYLAHFAGPGGAVALLKANPEASAESVLGPGAISANPHLRNMTASDVIEWAARKMGSSVETDPTFDSVPLDVRQAAYRDAEKEVNEELANRLAQQKADFEARFNDLKVGLSDGRYGMENIRAAREDGWLTKYEDINSAENIWEEKNKEAIEIGKAVNRLNSGGLWLDDEEGRKQQNLLIGKAGVASLQGMDSNYVNQWLLPNGEKTGMYASQAIDTLEAMIRSGDVRKQDWAMDVLSQMQARNAGGFALRASEKLQQDMDFWRAAKDYLPAEERTARLMGARTPQEEQSLNALRKEARDKLASSKNNIKFADTLFSDVIGDFPDGAIGSPDAPAVGWQMKGMQREFNELWVEMYARYANEDQATAATVKALQRSWGLFNGVVMKNAPDKAKYTSFEVSIADEQIRTEYGLSPNEQYQLISDEQTQNELNAYERGERQRKPSYRVAKKDANGNWVVAQRPSSFPGPQMAPAGLVEPGNIDLATRPEVPNPDGSISTVRSMSFEQDGVEILVPTVSDDGRLLSQEEAIEQYRTTGRHLGKFTTPEEATQYAFDLHSAQERFFKAGRQTSDRIYFEPTREMQVARDTQFQREKAEGEYQNELRQFKSNEGLIRATQGEAAVDAAKQRLERMRQELERRRAADPNYRPAGEAIKEEFFKYLAPPPPLFGVRERPTPPPAGASSEDFDKYQDELESRNKEIQSRIDAHNKWLDSLTPKKLERVDAYEEAQKRREEIKALKEEHRRVRNFLRRFGIPGQ